MDVLRDVFEIHPRVLLACAFLVFFLVLVVVLYVVAPVRIRFHLRHAARPRYVSFSLDDVTLPWDDIRDFEAVIDQLRPAGFEPVAVIALPRATLNIKSVQLYLANRRDKDLAGATAMYATTDGITRRVNFHVWISSRFRDSAVVMVSNSTHVSSFPPRPGFTTGRFPGVRDAARLYRLQQAMVERSGLTDKAFRLDEEFGGNAAAYQSASSFEELQDAARAGYMELSPEGDTYQPTWKGAFLMTWRQLWPAKLILLAAQDYRAYRLVAQLEGDQRERA
jgi:hypothetical protein